MLRQAYRGEMQRIQDEVLYLGSMVERMLVESVEALKRRDFEASHRLIAQDRAINEKRYDIENSCFRLIARQQPMAGDLRLIAAALEIAGELERMSDYAKGIAKINVMCGTEPLLPPIVDLPAMAEKVTDMLRRALEAFATRNIQMARAIPLEDDEVDAFYEQIYHGLINVILQDPAVADRANHLLWAAHNLERTADRVTNICERVIFTVTGELIEMDSEVEAPPDSRPK